MRIESDVKLDFIDVLLKPKRSTIVSRKDIQLERTFKFRHSSFSWTGIPIISSNMTSVTTPEVAKIMIDHGMLACIPKNTTGTPFKYDNIIPSYGLVDSINYDMDWVCLDVPNGYLEVVIRRVKEMRMDYDGVIIAGNVVTAEQTEALILAGADIVKVGIGSGAACSTRIKTGVGMPQLSAIMECSDAAHGLGGHIISDGGCVVTGDIVKALAAGADYVMLGGMLAGHDENGTSFYGSSSERGNNELNGTTCNVCGGLGEIHHGGRGGDYSTTCSTCKGSGKIGGLKDYRASEGWEIKLQPRGSIANTLQDITGGLRSACSYVGAKNLKSLPKCATFIQVNRQANQSMWDNRI